MNLQLLFDFLGTLQVLQGFPIALLIAGLVFIIVSFNQYQLSLLILPFVYFFSTILFAESIDPILIIAKLLTGWFVCLILAVSAKQVAQSGHSLQQQAPAIDPLYRIGVGVIATAVLTILATIPRLMLPVLPETAVYLNIVIFLLTGLGVLGIFLSATPINSGLGLLIFLMGFELYYSYLGPSLRTNLLFTAVNLSLALLIAYLGLPTAQPVQSST